MAFLRLELINTQQSSRQAGWEATATLVHVVGQLKQLNELCLGIYNVQTSEDLPHRLFSAAPSLTTVRIQGRKWNVGDTQGEVCTPFWDDPSWRGVR